MKKTILTIIGAVFIIFIFFFPKQSFEVLGNKDDLISFSISPGSRVFDVVEFSGSLQNGYFVEGEIEINILDKKENVLKNGYANAVSDWMTLDSVEFEGEIDFSDIEKGFKYIELRNNNLSNNEGFDKNILVPVIVK